MVANLSNNSRYSRAFAEPLIKAQIHNSLDIGWDSNDICLISNFDFEFMGIKAISIPLNSFCLTGSKIFAMHWLFFPPKLGVFANCTGYSKDTLSKFPIFSHDLDAWQNDQFEVNFLDVGISTYSNSKLNGGVVFWKFDANDIIEQITDVLIKGEHREEPTLNRLLLSSFKDRTTILNNTFNVGCSGFVTRATRAEQPIKVVHLNPYNRIAWETHRLDRNGTGIVSVSPRLEKILRQYFPHLATELSDEGKARQKELIVNPKSKKHHPGKQPKSIKRKIDNNFYARDLRPDRQHTYKSIVDCCMNLFPNTSSVIDFGCGSAWMLYYFFQKYYCEIKGIELNQFAQIHTNQEIREFIDTKDLTHEIKLPKKFDLALCLEVAEHIEDKYADIIISNITKAAPILVFSAASPGQGGSEHVNERFFEYWVEKLLRQNFELCLAPTTKAKEFLREAKIKSWYSNNISIFKVFPS